MAPFGYSAKIENTLLPKPLYRPCTYSDMSFPSGNYKYWSDFLCLNLQLQAVVTRTQPSRLQPSVTGANDEA